MNEPHTKSPSEIEAMAREAGLSMNEVCRRAGMPRSNFTRWKNETRHAGKGLTLKSYGRLLTVIEAAQADNEASEAV